MKVEVQFRAVDYTIHLSSREMSYLAVALDTAVAAMNGINVHEQHFDPEIRIGIKTIMDTIRHSDQDPWGYAPPKVTTESK